MAQETNQTQVPMLCTTGCGFYGNPRTNGMCSVCYKDFLQRQNSNGRISPPASANCTSLAETYPVQCTEGNPPEVPSSFSSSTSEQSSPQPILGRGKRGRKQKEKKGRTIKREGRKGRKRSVPNQLLLLSQESVANTQSDGEHPEENQAIPKKDLQASTTEEIAQTSSDGQEKSPEKPKQKKNRCFTCRKKVGLTEIWKPTQRIFADQPHRTFAEDLIADVETCSADYIVTLINTVVLMITKLMLLKE
eukprot:gi/632938552/ref/XP_007905423.1/ PREDICTED: AN1-type zinc finger protein 6 isoform X1 [Callorhinchus milii]